MFNLKNYFQNVSVTINDHQNCIIYELRIEGERELNKARSSAAP